MFCNLDILSHTTNSTKIDRYLRENQIYTFKGDRRLMIESEVVQE